MKKILLLQSGLKAIAEKREYNGILRFAKSNNWQCIRIPNAYRIPSLSKLLSFWHPDGCIVCNVEQIDRFLPKRFGDIPVTYLDIPEDLLPASAISIHSNSKAIGEMAAQELITCGYTNFAYVKWFHSTYWSDQRLSYFNSALAISGFQAKVFTPLKNGYHNHIGLQSQLRKFILSLQLPTAVFAANDTMSEQVLHAAIAEKLRVPEDLSILGVDNDESICESTPIHISSILPDFESAGYQIADALHRRINGNDSPRRLTFAPLCTIHRRSTLKKPTLHAPSTHAVAFIREHQGLGITVDDVASTMKLSRRLAEMNFKQNTGQTIRDAILETRLSVVKNLLRQKDITLTAIANRCGWSNLSLLCRYFRKAEHMTLSHYRHLHTR